MDTRYTNLDANESAFFTRQLEHIKSQVYPVLYPELRARQFLPVDSSAGDGADRITYRTEDMAGQAKLITDYAADLPRADVSGEEATQKVRDLGISFGWNVRELRAAARAGTDLGARKAMAARKAAELKLDNIAATGDTVGGLNGFVNHSAVSAASAVNGSWSTATAAEILEDINDGPSTIRAATLGIHGGALTLLLPEARYTQIAQQRVDAVSDTTILKFVLQTNPFIKEIMPWYKLTGQGAGATDRMVFYERNPDVLTLEIPNEFEMMEPQARNLEMVVPCRLVTAGVIVYRPKAMLYRDAI